MNRDIWNRCDVCGKFIPFVDFQLDSNLNESKATRRMLTPDSEFSEERYETLCKFHSSLIKEKY
jgi:hypothetical protein